MAKSVWKREEELEAFRQGGEAAAQGLPRNAPPILRTYNERAAFNDGWDSNPGYSLPRCSRCNRVLKPR